MALNVGVAIRQEDRFNRADFMIKDYGVDEDGNPFLTVQGNAGETLPQKENAGFAYVFVTNTGTYAVSSDWMYPQWHTHEITLDEKNCVSAMGPMSSSGVAEITDKVKLTKTNATIVYKVMTAEFTLSDSDGSICATKVFDSVP